MGMDFGILAADMSWPSLLFSLENRTGAFIDQGPAGSLRGYELDHRDGSGQLFAGEFGNKAFVHDRFIGLSDDPDLIVGIASDTGRLVVGCGAETISDTYWLIAAHGSELLRFYWHCSASTIQPYNHGNPLPTEKDCPLDDPFGSGIFAALDYFGFDYGSWEEGEGRQLLLYTGDNPPATGSLGLTLREHVERFRIPGPRVPGTASWPLSVVAMRESGFVIRHERATGGSPSRWRRAWETLWFILRAATR